MYNSIGQKVVQKLVVNDIKSVFSKEKIWVSAMNKFLFRNIFITRVNHGRTSVENDPHSRHPKSAPIPETVKK